MRLCKDAESDNIPGQCVTVWRSLVLLCSTHTYAPVCCTDYAIVIKISLKIEMYTYNFFLTALAKAVVESSWTMWTVTLPTTFTSSLVSIAQPSVHSATTLMMWQSTAVSIDLLVHMDFSFPGLPCLCFSVCVPLPCILLNTNWRIKTGEAWERG